MAAVLGKKTVVNYPSTSIFFSFAKRLEKQYWHVVLPNTGYGWAKSSPKLVCGELWNSHFQELK